MGRDRRDWGGGIEEEGLSLTLTQIGRESGDTDTHSCSYPTITDCMGNGTHSSPRAAVCVCRCMYDVQM